MAPLAPMRPRPQAARRQRFAPTEFTPPRAPRTNQCALVANTLCVAQTRHNIRSLISNLRVAGAAGATAVFLVGTPSPRLANPPTHVRCRPAARAILARGPAPPAATGCHKSAAFSAPAKPRPSCWTPPTPPRYASRLLNRTSGGIGRRAGFRFRYRKVWGFKSLLVHNSDSTAESDATGCVM